MKDAYDIKYGKMYYLYSGENVTGSLPFYVVPTHDDIRNSPVEFVAYLAVDNNKTYSISKRWFVAHYEELKHDIKD